MNIIRTLIRRWKITVPTVGVAVLGLAWLAFGYFGIHTAFIDDKVSEAAPEFAIPAAPAADLVSADVPDDAAVSEGGSNVADDVDRASSAEPVASEAPVEAEPVAESAEPVATADTVEAVESSAPEQAESAVGEIVTEASGTFAGTSRYDVSGEANVLGNGTGQRFLRFENFESNNGPDLNVYLVNPDDPNDFIDLGDLKGNIGDQNYEIPADVDLERYSEVSIWCVRFGVGFGSADLEVA